MIQDIAPYVFDNHYESYEPESDSFMIFVKNNETLALQKDSNVSFPEISMLNDFPNSSSLALEIREKAIYLFAISNRKFFLVENESLESRLIELGYAYLPLYTFRVCKPKHFSFAAITAAQLALWYRENRLCGCCGKPFKKDDKERMLRCDDCGIQLYPKISPAVIIAVTNGDKLLLSKYAGREYTHYALLAGFTEIGETIEDTVRREVMEEVGLKVKNLQFYKSQPWSLSSSILFGFYCELDGSDEIHIDKNELSLAEWVDRKDLPVYQDDISLTYEMIANFRDKML